MSTYLAEKYSNLLNDEEIVDLFQKIKETYRSISEAAKICGLERKTVYLWKETGFIKPKTKEKVVKALLEIEPEQTLSYLTKRGVDNAVEILMTNLSTIYEKAMEETDREKFLKLAELFDQIKIEHSGLIIDKLQREVNDLTFHIDIDAKRKGVAWESKSFEIFKTEQLETIIPMIAREILTRRWVGESEIATHFNLSESLIVSVSEAMQEVILRTNIFRQSWGRMTEAITRPFSEQLPISRAQLSAAAPEYVPTEHRPLEPEIIRENLSSSVL